MNQYFHIYIFSVTERWQSAAAELTDVKKIYTQHIFRHSSKAFIIKEESKCLKVTSMSRACALFLCRLTYIYTSTFKSNVNTIQCHLYNFIFMNENDIYKIQVHNLQFSLRLLIQCQKNMTPIQYLLTYENNIMHACVT